MQYAQCGREFLANQAKRTGENIKHIGPAMRLERRPTDRRFRTLCELGVDDGTWWYVNQQSDSWCITCLDVLGMPYTVHDLEDDVKIYVLTRTAAHYKHWLLWLAEQMSQQVFRPTNIYPIKGRGSIDPKTSKQHLFLYYVSGYQRVDFTVIDEKIRDGLKMTPQCAICNDPLEGQDFHEQCILPVHTWKNGRVQMAV